MEFKDNFLTSRNSISRTGPLSRHGSAKAARRGVTLAHPLCMAQASDPTGGMMTVGFITSAMSGDHLNNKGLVSWFLISGTSAKVRASGPASGIVRFWGFVEIFSNRRPYEFRHKVVQHVSRVRSARRSSIIGMLMLYKSTSPCRNPEESEPQLCQRWLMIRHASLCAGSMYDSGTGYWKIP